MIWVTAGAGSILLVYLLIRSVTYLRRGRLERRVRDKVNSEPTYRWPESKGYFGSPGKLDRRIDR